MYVETYRELINTQLLYVKSREAPFMTLKSRIYFMRFEKYKR